MQHLRNAGINNRVYFFESRAPSYSKDEETAKSGFFWVIASPRHIGRVENFYRHFQKTEWCGKKTDILDNQECFAAAHRVGVFVDVENMNSARQLSYVFDRIKTIAPSGEVVRRAAYGKTGEQRGKIIAFLKASGFEMHSVKPGADEADLSLSSDIGRSIFQSHIDIAIVLSGDDDFRFVARQARELGVPYFGVGNNNTTNQYRDECEEFYELQGNKPANYKLERGARKAD